MLKQPELTNQIPESVVEHNRVSVHPFSTQWTAKSRSTSSWRCCLAYKLVDTDRAEGVSTRHGHWGERLAEEVETDGTLTGTQAIHAIVSWTTHPLVGRAAATTPQPQALHSHTDLLKWVSRAKIYNYVQSEAQNQSHVNSLWLFAEVGVTRQVYTVRIALCALNGRGPSSPMGHAHLLVHVISTRQRTCRTRSTYVVSQAISTASLAINRGTVTVY